MTERLPRITATEVIRALERAGFSVPFHASVTLHPKLFRSILRDADLTVDELQQFLK